MIKRMGSGILLLMFSAFFSGVSAQTLVDRILVLVDDRIITQVALEEAFAPIKERIEAAGYGAVETQSLLKRYRSEMLSQMIDQTITDMAVEESGIEISDQEVEQAVEQFRLANNLSPEAFEKALMAEGLTPELYRRQTRDQMLRSRLVNYKVRSRIVVTREDIAAFYQQNPQRFGGGKRYRLAHILLPAEASADGDSAAKGAALLRSLDEGTPFAELAGRESVSRIAGPGGDLGWFDAEALSPVIREAVSDLPEGGVSGLLQTPQGFQIFQVLEVDVQAAKPLEEVSDEIADLLYEQEVNQRFQEWIRGLREKAHVRMVE